MNVRSAEFVTSVGFLKQLPEDGRSEVAFAGRSNVGKSSMLNRLFHRKNLVKTSGTPGKTRLLNFFLVNQVFYCVDMPGYGYARRSMSERAQWGRLIEGYLMNRPALKGMVQLIDARHDPTQDDLQMLDWLVQTQKPFVVVATKVDKLSGSKRKSRLDQTRRILSMYGEVPMIPFSSVSGQGKDEVWRWVEEVLDV